MSSGALLSCSSSAATQQLGNLCVIFVCGWLAAFLPMGIAAGWRPFNPWTLQLAGGLPTHGQPPPPRQFGFIRKGSENEIQSLACHRSRAMALDWRC